MRELNEGIEKVFLFLFNIHRAGCSVELPLGPNEWKEVRRGKTRKLSMQGPASG